jgi:hypothetical protein
MLILDGVQQSRVKLPEALSLTAFQAFFSLLHNTSNNFRLILEVHQSFKTPFNTIGQQGAETIFSSG